MCNWTALSEFYAAIMGKALNNTNKSISHVIIHCSQTGVTHELLYFLAASPLTTHWTAGKASSNLVQQWADAPNFAIHPLTAHYQKCTQRHARPCGWDGAHIHAHDACTRPQKQTHTLTQVLSGLTLNKWSIHLSSQNVASINRCCLMPRSSRPAGGKMSHNF